MTLTSGPIVTGQVLWRRVDDKLVSDCVTIDSVPCPTYEQLADLIVAQAAELARLTAHLTKLDAHIARQDARNAELERQLAANSRNSSKPPSSDGLGKPAPKSLRTKTGRKPGGQHGHKGDTLRQITDPDEVIRHEPLSCTGCGEGLTRATEVGVVRRQIFDLPPETIHVTEHQLISRRCHCGTSTRADAPAGVNAPVQYGPRVSAVMVYLYMGQYLSKAHTAHALSELFGKPVSAGTVSAATARAADDLGEFRTEVTARIIASDVVHFDETGFRAVGALHWLYSASTSLLTLVTCHRRRGREAMNAAGILPAFTGIAVHDAWSPYDTYPQLTHALCNAHLLRDLIAVVDHHQAYADDPRSWCWETESHRLFDGDQRPHRYSCEACRSGVVGRASAFDCRRRPHQSDSVPAREGRAETSGVGPTDRGADRGLSEVRGRSARLGLGPG
ncbi:IS66 family transposase [Rhodococcus sp. GOMB7]|uniref:IS66 family transposase n=1 Tax=Rhodococcus sp. GOMB7 TaxID=2839033 RepID=UPI001C002F57|nr:IS66 family transposase [Rhodococcus sp. GOMB7]MBT9298990.1 IS66 family transposase [Rhodococcus sp. GOMB7]